MSGKIEHPSPPKKGRLQVKAKRQPLYQQLKDALREQILRGDLRSGELVPSEKQLSAEYQVSSITVRRGLNDLAQEGFLQRVQGKGTYVRPRDALKMARHIGVFYHELVALTSVFAATLLKGVFDQAGQGTHQPELLSWEPIRRSAEPATALMDLVRQRCVDGLLIMSPAPLAWLEEVLKAGIPVVSINIEYEHPKVYGTTSDLVPGMERLGTEFARLGHHRILVLKGAFPEATPGVIPSLDFNWPRHSFEISRETVSYSQPSQVESVVKKHLSSHERPSLFFVQGYELALQVRHCLEAQGHSIPEGVSLVVLGASPGPSVFSMELHLVESMAVEATRMLGTLMAGHVPPRRIVRIPTRSRPGKTLGPAPSAPRMNRGIP